MHNHGVGAWMSTRRLKSPDKVALIHGEGETLTYRELADDADRVSALLWHRGIRKGDAVAYLGENSPDFLRVLFGAAQLGAIFVPLNTRLAAPELAYMLADSGARLVVHDPEFGERLAPGIGEAKVAHVIPTAEGDASHPGLSTLMRQSAGGHADVTVVLDDPAVIIYTSGTTGKPKGALLSNGNLTWVSLNCIVDYDVVSNDVNLLISPLFHVASLGMGALPVLMKGGTIVLEKGFDAGRVLSLIQKHSVSMLSGVPTTYQLLADHPDWATTDLSTLAKLTCGGSAVPTRVLNAYEERGLSFSQGYGMTETSPGATSLSPAMTREKQGSVGLPHFFTDVRIADENGAMVPRGTVGEIEISGPNVFLGYHGNPEATAEAFTSDGWFRSGDLGYLDADGYLYIADRLKDMIISGGENIYSAEVENALAQHPAVAACAVIGIPSDQWGESVHAVVVLKPDVKPEASELIDHCKALIAGYKCPRSVDFVAALPLSGAGKVLKTTLREPFWKGRTRNVA